MRELLYALAALAGAAILTAMAVIIPPSSPLWKWVLWGGIGVLAACFVVLLVDYLKPGGGVYYLGGMGVGITLAILFGIPVFVDPITITPSHAKITLGFHQAKLPITCPPEGHLFTMHLWHDPNGNPIDSLFLDERHCQPGEALNWVPQQYKIAVAFRCEVTNYESQPILQVRLSFGVEYRRAEKTESGSKEGELVHEHDRPVIIPKIDAGPGNAFVFYIYNDGVSYARVLPLKSAAYSHPGATELKKGELQIIGLRSIMLLPPRLDN